MFAYKVEGQNTISMDALVANEKLSTEGIDLILYQTMDHEGGRIPRMGELCEIETTTELHLDFAGDKYVLKMNPPFKRGYANKLFARTVA